MEYHISIRRVSRKTLCHLDADLIAKSAHLMQEKITVESGYNLLMRYNPNEKKLYMDSKEPDFSIYENVLDTDSIDDESNDKTSGGGWVKNIWIGCQ